MLKILGDFNISMKLQIIYDASENSTGPLNQWVKFLSLKFQNFQC